MFSPHGISEPLNLTFRNSVLFESAGLSRISSEVLPQFTLLIGLEKSRCQLNCAFITPLLGSLELALDIRKIDNSVISGSVISMHTACLYTLISVSG